MLKRAHIQGFKSLLNVKVELSPLVVVLGPNAAGKSNFLEAVLLLSRLATERTLAEALEPPMRGYPIEAFSLPDNGLPSLLSQESAELSIEADVQPAASEGKKRDLLRYRAGIRITPKSGVLEVVDEYLVRLKRDGTPKHKPRIERVEDHLVVRRLGEAGQPRQEPIGLNHTLISNLQFTGETRYPDFDQLRNELGAWRTYYLDPRVAMREPQPPKETTDIGPRGESIAQFLHRLKESPGVNQHLRAILRALRAAIPTVESLEVELDKQHGTLDIKICQEGTPYSSRVISEGTLRVLALCAIAGNPWPNALVAFEEPENGVHPRRIEVIAELLVGIARSGGRQVLVTTHSPTFAATMARLRQEHPDLISLLRCTQEGRATVITPFEALQYGPLFQDEEIRKALTGHEDADLIEEMLVRGWLDG